MNNPDISITKTQDLGILFSQNNVNMIGQDAAYSIPLNKNESLWLFGDTFIGTIDETGRRLIDRMPNNTGLICRSRNAINGLSDFEYITDEAGNIRQLIPLMPGEQPQDFHIWGMHGCYINHKIYWYFIRVRILPGAQWPYKFDVAGTGLAVADYPELIFHRLQYNESTILWQKDEPCYGIAVLPEKNDGFIYVYGTYLKEGIHYCSIARVTYDYIDNISQYEYLSSPKSSWSGDRHKAISIMKGMPTEMSVSYNDYLGCYLAVHSWENVGRIVGRTAPAPWGPWSEPVILWTSKTPLRNPLVYNGPMVYAGKEHPELSQENGKVIYLTCVEFEEYYPRLIEVTFN